MVETKAEKIVTQHTDLNVEVYLRLKEMILRRQLRSGTKLTIAETANMLGVSRTPVVFAMRKLAADGLVEIHPRRGAVVKVVTAKDVKDIFDVRLMIETFAAQEVLAQGKVADFLRKSQKPLNDMVKAISHDRYKDYEKFIQGDQNFHLLLVSFCENQHLIKIYKQLNIHIYVVRAHYVDSVESAHQSEREHAAILESFESGDAQRVCQSVTTHITNVQRQIVQLIEQVNLASDPSDLEQSDRADLKILSVGARHK